MTRDTVEWLIACAVAGLGTGLLLTAQASGWVLG